MSTVVPLTIESINSFIDLMSVIHKWEILTPTIRINVLCPTGGITAIRYSLPQGKACTRSEPLILESDYYHEDIKASVYVDGRTVSEDMQLTNKIVMSLGHHFIKRSFLEVDIDNQSGTDINLTIQFPCHMVKESVVDFLMIPLFKKVCDEICGWIGVNPDKIP